MRSKISLAAIAALIVALLVPTAVYASNQASKAAAVTSQPTGMYAYYYLWWSASHWTSALGPNFPTTANPWPLPATLDSTGCNPTSSYAGNVETDTPAQSFTQDDPAQITYDVNSAIAAGLTGFAVDWKGDGTANETTSSGQYNSRLDALVKAVDTADAGGANFHLWLSYEASATTETQAQIENDLSYFDAHYGTDPAFDHSNGGKPTFIWVGSYKYSTAVVTAISTEFRPSLYFVGGYQWNNWSAALAPYFDADSPYWSSQDPVGNAASFNQLKGLSATLHGEGLKYFAPLTPGFDRELDGSAGCVPRNNGQTLNALYQGNLQGSPDGWLLISWNEITEGTYVTPELQRYGADYGGPNGFVHAIAMEINPPPAPTTTTTTQPATADAYVLASSPSTNYGSMTVLDASATSYHAYVDFDTSAIPVGATISNASVTVTPTMTEASGGFTIRPEPSTWTESGLTWANQPTWNPTEATSSTPAPGTALTTNVAAGDVTPGGMSGFGFGYSVAGSIAKFQSREGASGPSLSVTWTRASGTTTTTLPSTTTTTTLPTTTSTTQPVTTTTVPVTTTTVPTGGQHITKILTIIEENHSYAQSQTGLPYLWTLAQQYGYASNYHAEAHPSLPNYLAIADGSTFGITNDDPPSSHPVAGPSIFDQALANGFTAKSYEDAMTSNCELTTSGEYAVKHNPWAYSSDPADRADCNQFDVPLGTTSSGALASDVAAGTLPNVGMLTPDLLNDWHDGTAAQANTFLSTWLPVIMAAPDFQSGDLAIVVTADEDNTTNVTPNGVLTVVITKQLNGAHLVVSSTLNHYSLSAWNSETVGATPLANGAVTPGMKAAFGLS